MSVANPSGSFHPGQKAGLGRFILERELGRGGMGVVWLALDTELNEHVALKFIPPEIRRDAEALDELRRETQRCRKLTHPNIIRIHDFLRPEGEIPFIAMEYVEGKTLSVLKIEQPQRLFTWEKLKPIAAQLCHALEYAHGEGVVHRDLKPGNMMLDSRGRLKLADFGLAACISDSISRVSQELGSSGTPAYMSPQQMDGRTPKFADDIYALGATLYELLTSKPPFYTGDILYQVRNLAADPLVQRLADLGLDNAVPPAVSALVMSCLSKDPEQRPASVTAVTEWIGFETSYGKTSVTSVSSPAPAVATGTDGLELSEGSEPATTFQSSPAGPGKLPLGLMFVAGFATVAILIFVFLKGRNPTVATADLAGNPSSVRNAEISPPPVSAASRATKNSPYENTLGMKFVPVTITGGPSSGQPVLFSVWETRVADYGAFIRESKRLWHRISFSQEQNHPAVAISWEDASAFCAWLTERERKAGRITSGEVYRLPSDHEWSCAVGIGAREAAAASPKEKNAKLTDAFPWGSAWPPPAGAGNYWSEELRPLLSTSDFSYVTGELRGYRDGYSATSPVGSGAANEFGLYDLGGNAFEWCNDWFDGQQDRRVMRGAAWLTHEQSQMLSSRRHPVVPRNAHPYHGFRCVLSLSSQAPSQNVSSQPRPGEWTKLDLAALSRSLGPQAKSAVTADGKVTPQGNSFSPGIRARTFAVRSTAHFPKGAVWANIGVGRDDKPLYQISVGQGWGDWSFMKRTNDVWLKPVGSSHWLKSETGGTLQMALAVTEKDILGHIAEMGSGTRTGFLALPNDYSGQELSFFFTSNQATITDVEVMLLDGVPESQWPPFVSEGIQTAKRPR